MSDQEPEKPKSVDKDRPRKRGKRLVVPQGVKHRGAEKVARIPIKVIPTENLPPKPPWIRVKVPSSGEASRIKSMLRRQKLHTVCEEASCPNLPECFGRGTATFYDHGGHLYSTLPIL